MHIQRTFKYAMVSLLFTVFTFAGTSLLGANIVDAAQRQMLHDRKAVNTPVSDTYGNIPLFFILNEGQCNKKVKFFEKSGAHATYFTEEGIYLHTFKKMRHPMTPGNHADKTTQDFVKLSFINASKNLKIEAQEKLAGRVNYFLGNDKSKWRHNLPTYKYVLYKNVYEGIDIKFYGNNRQLEYDIIVHPAANPSAVTLLFEGMDRVNILDNQELEFVLDGGNILQKKPYIYQEIDGKKVETQGSLKFVENTLSGNPVSPDSPSSPSRSNLKKLMLKFEVAQYDTKYPLIIDPVLAYSSYLGGTGADVGSDIAVDASGNAYIVGSTYSPDFPTGPGVDPTYNGGWDAFITKVNSSGTALVYSSYIGGSGSGGSGNGDDYGQSIAIDTAGNAYITGRTQSYNFPVVSWIQQYKASFMTDVFVTKINAAGSAILFSTFLGGTQYEASEGIALDSAGNIYITGYTGSSGSAPNGYPTTSGAFKTSNAGGRDAFVTKISGSSLTLTYSTYLGGNSADEAWDIAVDDIGNAYITGDTYSTNLGGSGGEAGFGIAVDAAQKAYVTGTTNSSDFPIWPNTFPCLIGVTCPYQSSFGGGLWDAFVTVINPNGQTLTYSTYIGGDGIDKGVSIAVDKYQCAYVAGDTNSSDFPTVNPIQASFHGGLNDAYLLKINPAGTNLLYSTYLGGSGTSGDGASGVAVNNAGTAYMTGVTFSSDFPVWPAPVPPIFCLVGVSCAFQLGYGGGSGDGWVAKIDNPVFNDLAIAAPPATLGQYEGLLYFATNDGSATCGNSSNSSDVWYPYTAPAAGTLLADTCGTHDMGGEDAGIDTVLSLHTGAPGTSGNETTDGCNDDWVSSSLPNACTGLDDGSPRDSAVAYDMADSETTFVRVSKYGSSEDGPFMLNLDFICAGDFEPDVDIDGSDLAYFASHATGIALDDLAANFGKTMCP